MTKFFASLEIKHFCQYKFAICDAKGVERESHARWRTSAMGGRVISISEMAKTFAPVSKN